MESKQIFFEKQKFRQWWIWLILIIILGVNTLGVIRQVVMGIPFGSKPAPNEILVLTTVFIAALNIFFWNIKLLTKIDERGIYIKFLPIHKKWRFYAWEEIKSVEVKQYNPTSEYGGWGIKPGAYNVAGNKGMLIRFYHRSSLMVGTQRPDDLKKVLSEMGRL